MPILSARPHIDQTPPIPQLTPLTTAKLPPRVIPPSVTHTPHARAPTSKGGHASSENPQCSVQSDTASFQPAPRNTTISNVAPITKVAPVAGDTNSKRYTNTHSTPNLFLPQGITSICLKPNLSLRVPTVVGRIRGPAWQPVFPTSTLSA